MWTIRGNPSNPCALSNVDKALLLVCVLLPFDRKCSKIVRSVCLGLRS